MVGVVLLAVVEIITVLNNGCQRSTGTIDWLLHSGLGEGWGVEGGERSVEGGRRKEPRRRMDLHCETNV